MGTGTSTGHWFDGNMQATLPIRGGDVSQDLNQTESNVPILVLWAVVLVRRGSCASELTRVDSFHVQVEGVCGTLMHASPVENQLARCSFIKVQLLTRDKFLNLVHAWLKSSRDADTC